MNYRNKEQEDKRVTKNLEILGLFEMTTVFPGYQIDCLSWWNRFLFSDQTDVMFAVGCSKLKGNIWNGKISFGLLKCHSIDKDCLISSTSSSLVEEKSISENVVTPCIQDEEILLNYAFHFFALAGSWSYIRLSNCLELSCLSISPSVSSVCPSVSFDKV